MSFEGYYDYLCKEGHLWYEDVYQTSETPACPVCNSSPEFCCLVDHTNGVIDTTNNSLELVSREEKFVTVTKVIETFKPRGAGWKPFLTSTPPVE